MCKIELFEQDLFYLKHSASNRYHSSKGMVESRLEASKFTELQIKKRLNVAKSYTKRFQEKLLAGGLVMERVFDQELPFKVESDIEYDEMDILLCDAKYWYGNKLVTGEAVYCPYRGNIKHPRGVSGIPDRVLFIVKSKHGKCNP